MNLKTYIASHPWKWTLFVVIFTALAVLYGEWEWSWIPYVYGVLLLVMYAVIRWDCRAVKPKPVYLLP